MYCFGSFLLQDLFLSLQVFPFKGQNMTLTVNMLHTRILYCGAGPGYDFRMICESMVVQFLTFLTLEESEFFSSR